MPFPILAGKAIVDTGYNVANSCRIDDGSSVRMYKTLGTPTNTKKFTISLWIKRVSFGATQYILNQYADAADWGKLFFDSSDQLNFFQNASDSTQCNLITSGKFRDPSAWMHICIAVDTEQGTAANRNKMYINGIQVTAFDTQTNFGEDDVGTWNSDGNVMTFGRNAHDGSSYLDCYLAEAVWIDGTQNAVTDFGEFDEDSPTIWKPKDVSGLTFGNNGFYLDFEDSSNLGNDANGGTDLTEVNLAAVDQATDVPTNNFCVFNVLNPSFTGTNSEGNCKHLSSSSAWRAIYGTIPFTTGKWYAEFKMVADGSSAGPGVINIDPAMLDIFRLNETNRGLGQGENAVAYLSNAQILDGGNTIKTGQTTWTDNDILGVAIDATNGFVYWHKNGTYLDGATSGTTVGVPTSGGSGTGGYPLADLVAANGTYLFGVGGDDAWDVEANFGGCPAFSISSGNADGDGYGNFEYAVPSGYYALCTKNLAEYG